MKKAYFVLWILLLFVQTGCSGQSNYQAQAPAPNKTEGQQPDPYSWDFGQVKEGEVLKHNFVLKNESQNVLNIKDINTSCGCTVSKVEKKTLLPGETTLIDVQFDTKGYLGQTQQYIYVNTDSLDASTSSLDFARDEVEARSRTIDNSIIRFIIKAEVVK